MLVSPNLRTGRLPSVRKGLPARYSKLSVLHEYFQQEATQSGLPTFPRLPFGQKRREHIQEALVKETGWNDEVAGPEQRGVLSVGYSQEEDRSSPCCSETERESFPSFSYSVYGRCDRYSP